MKAKKYNCPCALQFFTAPILEPKVLPSQQPLVKDTDKLRQVRLEKHSAYKKERLADESKEERADRLLHMSALKKRRLANESEEERAERLSQMSALQKQRLATESEEERAQRLSQKSALQKQRLANESEEHRADRLTRMRDIRPNEVNHSSKIDLLQVKAKLLKFHREIGEINVPTCTICDETFPGMAVNKKSECIRCTRDKRTPKLFSADNDMHPGAVPAELQVCFSCLMQLLIACPTTPLVGRGIIGE
jgi:hypothetical protein